MQTATATTPLRVIGITDEQTECDRCGRMELRNTVILGGEEGEVGRYGTSCASNVLGFKVTAQDARTVEAHRRYLVRDELRLALAASRANDLAAMAMYIDGARRVGIVRDDEIALIARMEGN